jgi:DNA recombination protein RmuC
MAQKDVDMIVTSADKLTKRGAKIEALEFESADASRVPDESAPASKSVESRTGLLKLRVVDDE